MVSIHIDSLFIGGENTGFFGIYRYFSVGIPVCGKVQCRFYLQESGSVNETFTPLFAQKKNTHKSTLDTCYSVHTLYLWFLIGSLLYGVYDYYIVSCPSLWNSFLGLTYLAYLWEMLHLGLIGNVLLAAESFDLGNLGGLIVL